MARRWGLTLAALAAAGALSAPAQAQIKSPSEHAVSALATFAIAYSAWLWEERCQEMDSARRAAFQRRIEGQLLRLTAIFEPRMVGAATGAGRDTAESPEMAVCSENAGYTDFGIDMANEADQELSFVPAGHTVRITD